MQEILWGSLALSALALSAALVALILSVRENVKKAGRTLDAVNLELPGILGAMRLVSEDLEAMLAWGGKLRRGLGFLGSLLKSVKEKEHSNSGGTP
jgi:hypothetical protein